MKREDLIKGLVLFLFALFFCYESTRLPLWSGNKPGPGLFPLCLGAVLGFLSLVYTIARGRRRETKAAPVSTEGRESSRILLTLGALIVYAVVIRYLGFLISSFFLVLYLLGLSYPKRWVLVGTASLLISAGMYVVFQVLLKVQLPYGLLGI